LKHSTTGDIMAKANINLESVYTVLGEATAQSQHMPWLIEQTARRTNSTREFIVELDKAIG
jgi:hypothetical protein